VRRPLIGDAGDHAARVAVTDQDRLARARVKQREHLADVRVEISGRGRGTSGVKAGQGDRVGLVSGRAQRLRHRFEPPSTMAGAGDQ
jgi:hypothetical protein